MNTDISISYDDECIDNNPYEMMHTTVCRSRTCFHVAIGRFSGAWGMTSPELMIDGTKEFSPDSRGAVSRSSSSLSSSSPPLILAQNYRT